MGNARATAMLNHYARCIGTPANLELLVGLILVRTGETLCIAVNLLIALSHYVFGHSSMDRPLSDGGVFSSHLIRTGSQFLQRSENRHHDCQCTDNVCMVLKDALEFSKERPGQLIDRLHFIAWNDILDFNYDKCDCCETPGGMKLYLQLVQIPGQLMLLGDTAETEKAKAKAMLLCLGSAQGLFRSCLELIATKKFSWLQDASSIPPERKSIETANVARASDFLFSFAAIAPSLPSDRPTSKLVQRASETLAKRRPQVSLWASESILQLYDAMTKSPFFTSWSRVRNESQETRWGLFHPAIQSIIHKCNTKKQRKSVKVDYRGRIGPEECCASCFRMERDLNDQGRSLSRCARCGLVWYCSKVSAGILVTSGGCIAFSFLLHRSQRKVRIFPHTTNAPLFFTSFPNLPGMPGLALEGKAQGELPAQSQNIVQYT